MRLSLTLLIFFLSYATVTFCRPAQLEEENNSEAKEGEYESDESPDDEYLHENEQTAIDESPEKLIRQDGIKNSEEQESFQDPLFPSNRNSDNNRRDFETITENKSDGRKKAANAYLIDSKYNRNERYCIENQNNNAASNIGEPESPQVDGELKRNLDYKNDNETPNGNTAVTNHEINENQHYNYEKYHDNRHVRNKLTKNNDYLYHVERNRRQATTIDEKISTDVNHVDHENKNVDNANENDILKNIKKLSEQDLEELLNSLPEDKKALLRKIMNKREITKKAGAIEDNRYLDQSETSKIEGSFSISSLSSLTGSTESSSKNDDNGEETSTKILYDENNSEKSENKSGDSDNTSTMIETTGSKDEANLNINNKGISKNENKRETNEQEIINENEPLKNIKNEDFESKRTNDYIVERELYNNENLFESNKEALKPQKREITEEEPLELSVSEKQLEDSFPRVEAYEDAEIDMQPLIRVKRTEVNHRVKKRGLPYLSSNIITSLENEPDNIESGEYENKGFLDSQSYYAKKDREVLLHRDSILNKTPILEESNMKLKLQSNISAEDKKIVSETDKISLGSDTDCVLSGIEGVDDNIMLNKGIKNRRSLSLYNTINTNTLNENENMTLTNRTRDNNDIIFSLQDSVDTSPYHIDAIFGPSSRSSQEDVGRYKRIKRLANH